VTVHKQITNVNFQSQLCDQFENRSNISQWTSVVKVNSANGILQSQTRIGLEVEPEPEIDEDYAIVKSRKSEEGEYQHNQSEANETGSNDSDPDEYEENDNEGEEYAESIPENKPFDTNENQDEER